MPQLLSIIIDILGEVEHNGDPHIVGSNLHITMVVVRAEESAQETIGVGSSVCRLAGLLIRQKFLLSILSVQVLQVGGRGRAGTRL